MNSKILLGEFLKKREEKERAPDLPTPKVADPLTVLVADGITDRANTFRMASNTFPKPSFVFRIVRNKEGLARSLAEKKWDVLIHSIYLGKHDHEPLDTLGMIVHAHKRGLLRAVIVTSSVNSDGRKLVLALRDMGVPCKYIPYNYQVPSQHLEVPVEAKLRVKP